MPAGDEGRARSATGRPEVLFLGHGAERTGPPILLGHLLHGLRERGEIEASVLVARSGPLLESYRRDAVRVRAVSADREPYPTAARVLRRIDLAALATRAQDLRRRSVARPLRAADLVYVNAATPPTAALLRALQLDLVVPVIVHVHELDVGLRQNLSDDERRLLFDRADHLIAASAPVADLLVDGHGIDADRVTTCEEFVDAAAVRPVRRSAARARLGIPADAAVVGSVGLPDWRKDPAHLLRAVATGTGPLDRAWVVWIGGTRASDDGIRLATEAERLGLADRFVHVDHHDDPSSLLGALDVFALPALEDAMPLAALEAAAAGLPIVCFRTGGIAGLCDAGAGTAVDYPDTAAFAGALAALLSDEPARRATGETAKRLVLERNDLGVGVDRIAAVIAEVLDRVPNRSAI